MRCFSIVFHHVLCFVPWKTETVKEEEFFTYLWGKCYFLIEIISPTAVEMITALSKKCSGVTVKRPNYSGFTENAFRGVTCKLKAGIIQIRFVDAYRLLPVNPIVYKYLGWQRNLKKTGAPQLNCKKFHNSMNVPAKVIQWVDITLHWINHHLLINTIRFLCMKLRYEIEVFELRFQCVIRRSF